MLKVIKTAPLEGNTIAPPLEMGKEYALVQTCRCKCGKEHYDVGLVSKVNWVTCHSCGEALPTSDSIHWCHPSRFEEIPEKTDVKLSITGAELGSELFRIHTHASIASFQNKDQIVYREKDIIELFKKFGFPEPVWGKIIDFKYYEKANPTEGGGDKEEGERIS